MYAKYIILGTALAVEIFLSVFAIYTHSASLGVIATIGVLLLGYQITHSDD